MRMARGRRRLILDVLVVSVQWIHSLFCTASSMLVLLPLDVLDCYFSCFLGFFFFFSLFSFLSLLDFSFFCFFFSWCCFLLSEGSTFAAGDTSAGRCG